MPAEVQKVVDAVWKPRMHKALLFNGTNSIVKAPSVKPVRYVTALCVFVPYKFYRSNSLVWQGGPNSTPWNMRIDQYGQLHFFIRDKTLWWADWLTNLKCNLKDINCAAVSYNGEKRMSCLNGNYTYISTNRKELNPAYAICIGHNVYSYHVYYTGLIALVKVWNCPFTKKQLEYITKHPMSNIKKEHLILDLNPAGIDIVNGKWWDLSGKGNDGTIHNTTDVVKIIEEEVSVL